MVDSEDATVDPREIPTRVDVLVYETADGGEYRSVEAGYGVAVVDAHHREYRNRLSFHVAKVVFLAAIVGVLVGLWSRPLAGAGAVAVVFALGWFGRPDPGSTIPALVVENAMPTRACDEYDIVSHSGDPTRGSSP